MKAMHLLIIIAIYYTRDADTYSNHVDTLETVHALDSPSELVTRRKQSFVLL
jgi:hypothetical protein